MSPSSVCSADTIRLGVVCFLNTLPLIDGLEGLDGLSLRFSVPSLLVDGLVTGETDVALCS
jgi:predicted solute-binding protein